CSRRIYPDGIRTARRHGIQKVLEANDGVHVKNKKASAWIAGQQAAIGQLGGRSSNKMNTRGCVRRTLRGIAILPNRTLNPVNPVRDRRIDGVVASYPPEGDAGNVRRGERSRRLNC